MPTSITCSVVSMPSHSFSFPCETFPPPSVVQGNTLPFVSPVSFPHPAFFPHLIFPKLEPDGPPPFLVRIPAHLPPRRSSMGTISLPSPGTVSFPSMWVVSSSAHYQAFLVGVCVWGALAKATAPAAGLLTRSPVTLISSWSASLGSQDANHIPKASQTIFPPWMESNMCSPFGTKCLSSVSDLPQTSVHWVPIVLPSFSLRGCSQPKPFLLGSGGGVGGGGGHAVESAWTQGRISVWYLPLLPKLGCHTESLRKTSEDTWTIQWRLSVSSLPPFLRGYCPWFSGVFL